MKHGNAVVILVLLMLAVGCAQKQQVKVTFLSDPPGGTLYEQDGRLWGPCPKVLWYDLNAEAIEAGYLNAKGLTVRWPTGPEKKSDKLIRITINRTDRRVVFVQPKDEPKALADVAGSQENKAPDEKQTELQEMKKLQSAETERIKKTLALSSKKPAVVDEPLVGPVGRILTLSEQQLILLDWHRSNRRGARVEGKRPVGGPGVEFAIYFPSNSPGSCSLSFVSTGAGGRGSLVGTDVRGYDVFALKLTLVSVNGRSDPALKQKLMAGAVFGPTAEGRLTGYEPVTLSLAASEKTVTAKTPVAADEIYEIGFHIHVLNHDDWDPSGSRVVLRVEPAEAGEAGSFNATE
ncbi:MAG: hypothetical protein ISS70_03830 [Phycisphaerae bacterium]|nr:hypothetical protein [Phycisphaerae bacterium]